MIFKHVTDTEPKPGGNNIIGYDQFYGRIGEVKRLPTGKFLFLDEQGDDCSIIYYVDLPLLVFDRKKELDSYVEQLRVILNNKELTEIDRLLHIRDILEEVLELNTKCIKEVPDSV